VSGPAEVCSAADQLLDGTGRRSYEVGVATMDGRPVTCSSGLVLGANWALTALDDVDTVLIAGGNGSRAAARDTALLARSACSGDRRHRTGSVCTEAFILAATGLLGIKAGRIVPAGHAAGAALTLMVSTLFGGLAADAETAGAIASPSHQFPSRGFDSSANSNTS